MPAIGRPLPPSAKNPGRGPWRLRPAQPADAGGLERLERELFTHEAWSLDAVLAELSSENCRYVVAVDDNDDPLGYAGIFLSPDTADIQTIGTIRPGCGIGTALLRWCETEAAAAGAQAIFLEVREDNDRARGLYRAAGFAEISVRKNYYRTATGRANAIVMAKQLA